MYSLPHLSNLPDWTSARRIGLDSETCDEHLRELGPGVRRGGYVTGVSFALEDGPGFYLPMRHQGGGNYENPEQVLAYLRHQAKHFRGEIVGANLGYDLDYFAELGIHFPNVKFIRDVQVSGPLLDVPNINGAPNRMSLDAQAQRWGLPGKDETKLLAYAEKHGLNPKSEMWKMPAWEVADYATQDAVAPLKLLRRQEREIDDQDIWQIYNMESELLPVLVKMRRRGVAVDLDKLGEIEELALKRETSALREVLRLSGVELASADVKKGAAIVPVLEAVGLTVPRLPIRISDKAGKQIGGGKSVTSPWLEGLEHPIGAAIRLAKKWNNIRNNFCKSVRTHEVNGRLHCTFNQLRQERDDGEMKGAQYGRMSSSQLNIQQQPMRDEEIGKLWRCIYLPDEGGTWACLDYSGQEPRWITEYAERCGVRGGFEAAEACRNEPDWDNHSMTAGMMYDKFRKADLLSNHDAIATAAKKMRSDAKEIFLGLCYGMGGAKLCMKVGLPTEWVNAEWANGELREVAGQEGKALLKRFHKNVPYVQALTKLAQAQAKAVGYIYTVYGRHCRFPIDKNGDYDWTHLALNRLIQGSSGDQTKLAMIEADKAGIAIQIAVHDEIDLTIGHPREALELSEIMCNVIPTRVPFIVDNEQGPNWGELKKA